MWRPVGGVDRYRTSITFDKDDTFVMGDYQQQRGRRYLAEVEDRENKQEQYPVFPRLSDIISSSSKGRQSQLPDPIPELVEHWQMQDQFRLDASTHDHNRRSVAQEARKPVSNQTSLEEREQKVKAEPRGKRQPNLHRSYLANIGSEHEDDESIRFVFNENMKSTSPWEDIRDMYFEPSLELPRRSVRLQQKRSKAQQQQQLQTRREPQVENLERKQSKEPITPKVKQEQQKVTAPEQKSILKNIVSTESILEPPKKLSKKRPERKKRQKSRSRPKPAQVSHNSNSKNSRYRQESAASKLKDPTNRGNSMETGEAPRKQRIGQKSTQQIALSRDDKDKETKKQTKMPAKKNKKRRKTKRKSGDTSPSTGSILSESLMLGEQYHKLTDKLPEDNKKHTEPQPKKPSKQSLIKFNTQTSERQLPSHEFNSQPISFNKFDLSSVNAPLSAGNHRNSRTNRSKLDSQPKSVEFVPIEELEIEQSESNSHRYPSRRRFKPMPYWQGSKVQRKKGQIIGITTRYPQKHKRNNSKLLSEGSQDSLRTNTEAFGIEYYIGVRSRHKLSKIPLIPNRYRLEVPVGEVFVVAAGSFRSITIRFVSGEPSKIYVDRGSGATRYADPTTISFPEGFTINNRSGSRATILELQIELLQNAC